MRPPELSLLDVTQYGRVVEFFSGFAAAGTHPGLVSEYRQPEEFERLVRTHLEQRLHEFAEAKGLGQPAHLAQQEKPAPEQVDPARHIPLHNPDFVGREAVMAELRRLLTEGQGPTVITQAITGLGGIGKTQTALAYCYRYLADYRLIWWLRAENTAYLEADYARLAKTLRLDPNVADPEERITMIHTVLPNHAPCLLVFDNVEAPAVLRAYLPRTGGHVLITSRRTDWSSDIAKMLPLELMLEAEALQLLTGRPDPEALPAPDLAEANTNSLFEY